TALLTCPRLSSSYPRTGQRTANSSGSARFGSGATLIVWSSLTLSLEEVHRFAGQRAGPSRPLRARARALPPLLSCRPGLEGDDGSRRGDRVSGGGLDVRTEDSRRAAGRGRE